MMAASDGWHNNTVGKTSWMQQATRRGCETRPETELGN